MKIEKRGKYAGVKVHLEPPEVEAFIKLHKDLEICGAYKGSEPSLADGFVFPHTSYFSLSAKLGKKLKTLLEEDPTLLKERTPQEIQHELEVELESATQKIAALKKGGNWKEIHIK